ncbi:MAG: ribose 5-phosphate isomerase B [Desulfobacterales bacterium]|jgi:ribose 5-phosphate isomerase B|nr:ribose 5-phosphate isomerase B [Desulfobacterales bacterium]
MENSSPIVIGCDHAGFALKELIKDYLTAMNCAVSDCGTYNDGSVDYPDFAAQVARKISSGQYLRGILICGTGIGMSMAANRFPAVRAALCNDLFSAIMSRRHNNANILVMGGRVIGPELAKEIVRAWIETPFEGGRHQSRIDKMSCMGT